MQRYQVFINEHLILLTERLELNFQNSEDKDSFYNGFLVINYEDDVDFEGLVKWLLEEDEAKIHLSIKSKDTFSLLNNFTSSFVSIEAAGGLVSNNQGELLTIYRLNKWDLPKGKIENGETKDQAALREVEEECGITGLSLVRELPTSYHIYFHKGALVLKTTYWFEMGYSGDERLIPQIEEAIQIASWMDKKEVEKLRLNTYRSLQDLFKYWLQRE